MTRRALLRTGGAGLAMALGPFAGLAAGRPPSQASAERASDALALAERQRGDLTDLLSSLVAIRSHSGESAEAAQEGVAGFLSRLIAINWLLPAR